MIIVSTVERLDDVAPLHDNAPAAVAIATEAPTADESTAADGDGCSVSVGQVSRIVDAAADGVNSFAEESRRICIYVGLVSGLVWRQESKQIIPEKEVTVDPKVSGLRPSTYVFAIDPLQPVELQRQSATRCARRIIEHGDAQYVPARVVALLLQLIDQQQSTIDQHTCGVPN